MAGPEAQNGSRIAIKFGNSSLSSASKGSRRPSPPSSLGKRQRSRQALNPDSDSDDGAPIQSKHERVTTLGEDDDHAPSPRNSRPPLTIEQLPNRDWKSEARARRKDDALPSKKPKSAPTTEGKHDTESVDKEGPLKWGLNNSRLNSGSAPEPRKDRQSRTNGSSSHQGMEKSKRDKDGGDNSEPVDSDEEAASILMGKKESNASKLIIHGEGDRVTEDDAFRRDFRAAPDESTLEDYDAMPVEEFGAALLRGMGWDGKDRGPKIKQVKRRANQLGLGAKELQGEEDLGNWNRKGSGKSGPPKLSDYRREEDKRREKRDEWHRDSYKQERDRERRERDRDHRGHRHRERR